MTDTSAYVIIGPAKQRGRQTKRIRFVASALAAALLYASQVLAQHQAQITDGRSAVSISEIQFLLGALTADERRVMTRNQLRMFIENLLIDKRSFQQADALKIPERPQIRAKIEKATRGIVVAAYSDEEVLKLAADLPNFEGVARERYEAEKGAYRSPEAIKVAHILLRLPASSTQSEETAVLSKLTEIQRELLSGVDFAALARKYSEERGADRTEGLLNGWQVRGKLVEPFEKTAFALKPGEISGPVKTQFGYHLIKLHEYRPETQLTFDQVKDPILSKLKSEAMAQRREDWLKTLRGSQPLNIDDATYEMLLK